MNAREVAALLSAQVQKYEPKGSGMSNELERVGGNEVSYGLAGADHIGSLLVRAKWGGDMRAVAPLYRLLYDLSLKRAVAHQWGVRKLEHIGGMVVLALVEQEVIYVDERSRTPQLATGASKCPKCHGTKYRFSRRYAKWYACKACSASGLHLIHEAQRAVACGMSFRSWRVYWRRRLERLRTFLGRAEGRALKSMRVRSLIDNPEIAQLLREMNRIAEQRLSVPTELMAERPSKTPMTDEVKRQLTLPRPILHLPGKARAK